jgi:4-amino-4-deoxy-L-arabinose transferase-like glycosyltransferase
MRVAAGAFCCLFLLLGMALIPYAGVQNDEALFSAPIYLLISKHIFRNWVPLMLLSYLGALKTWIYVPIFKIFGVSVWSVRLPMVLTGALTVWFFFRLCELSLGVYAALFGAALLATDPIFLMADTFDWGPVAIEHFLLVTGCFFLVRFAQKETASRPRDLALGFFCFGLALWNKALFLWALAGLISGGAVVFWPEIRAAVRVRRNVAIAAGAFVLGALPFIIYNVSRPNDTLSSNANFEAVNLTGKLRVAEDTLNGTGLFGYMVAEEWSDGPKAPSSPRGRLAFWIRDQFGERRKDALLYAFVLALLAVPLWWRSRPARFSLVFLVVTWYAMAFTHNAGAAVHHTVLLWPFPHMFIAAVLAWPFTRQIPDSGRKLSCAIALAAGVVLVVFNLLVVNQYLYQFERNGAAGNYTDALNTLSDALADPPRRVSRQSEGATQTVEDQPIYVVDWGMLNTLGLLHQGRLTLREGTEPFNKDDPRPFERRMIAIMFSDPNALFIGHTEPRMVFPDVAKRLDQAALAAGLHKALLRTISDSNGHPVFEIFRLER